MRKENQDSSDLNPRNSKPISLHPFKPEDAIRAALMTPAQQRLGRPRYVCCRGERPAPALRLSNLGFHFYVAHPFRKSPRESAKEQASAPAGLTTEN
jgi:hypothetical protein